MSASAPAIPTQAQMTLLRLLWGSFDSLDARLQRTIAGHQVEQPNASGNGRYRTKMAQAEAEVILTHQGAVRRYFTCELVTCTCDSFWGVLFSLHLGKNSHSLGGFLSWCHHPQT